MWELGRTRKNKRKFMDDFICKTENLAKRYGDFDAVKGINFTIKKGEVFGLLGPNGAGKSTTIGMLACLLAPTGGDARLGNHSIVSEPDKVKEVIGYVPQELALYDKLSARQNLRFWGTMAGMRGPQLTDRIDELLKRVELIDRADKRVETFSGGMKRRLNIAVGLMHKPQLVFMDEPTVGIDPQSRRRILDMVKELKAEGMSVLYTTHYMEEAEELSDTVGIIDHGEMIALGSQAGLRDMIGEQDTLRLHFDAGRPLEPLLKRVEELDFVTTAILADDALVVSVPNANDALPILMERVTTERLRVRSIDIDEPNLEAVFLHLTGRRLRE